ncbi:transcription initiation protein [Colletotrichum chrysophilum]|uniref:Transcription initiation factor IIB n=1 Tax=Colletotrichum chrysophilum TaxID=1836956 RepID=A0AAD9AG41_9PEZI|nr:transcription initiation protein [Colletotrichum chrysophilum]
MASAIANAVRVRQVQATAASSQDTSPGDHSIPSSNGLGPSTSTPGSSTTAEDTTTTNTTTVLIVVIILCGSAIMSAALFYIFDRKKNRQFREACKRDPYLTRKEFTRRRKLSALERLEEEELQRSIMIRKSLASKTPSRSTSRGSSSEEDEEAFDLGTLRRHAALARMPEPPCEHRDNLQQQRQQQQYHNQHEQAMMGSEWAPSEARRARSDSESSSSCVSSSDGSRRQRAYAEPHPGVEVEIPLPPRSRTPSPTRTLIRKPVPPPATPVVVYMPTGSGSDVSRALPPLPRPSDAPVHLQGSGFPPLQPTNVTRSLAFTKIVCSTAKPHLRSLIARFGPASSESNHFANRRIRPLRADCSVIWTGNWDSGGSLFRHSRTPSLVEIGRLARKEDTFAFLLSFSPRLSSSPYPLLRLYHRRLNCAFAASPLNESTAVQQRKSDQPSEDSLTQRRHCQAGLEKCISTPGQHLRSSTATALNTAKLHSPLFVQLTNDLLWTQAHTVKEPSGNHKAVVNKRQELRRRRKELRRRRKVFDENNNIYTPKKYKPKMLPSDNENAEGFRDDLNMVVMCPDCKEYPPNLVEEFSSGDMVCGSCGLVVGERIIDTRSEWRTFANDDQGNDDPSRVGDAVNPLLNGSQLETTIAFGDGRDSKQLARLQNKSQNDKASKSLMQAYKEIGAFCDSINLGKNVSDAAKHIFKLTYDHNFMKGKPQEAVIAGCIFIACRQTGVGRTFREIFQVTHVSKKEIGRVFKQLESFLQKIKEENPRGAGSLSNLDGYKASASTSAEDLCTRFCSNLNFRNAQKIENVSRALARKTSSVSELAGRSPLSVAAACIYMAAHLMAEPKTSKAIAGVAGVSDGTIKTAYRFLYNAKGKLVEKEWGYDKKAFDTLPSN